MTREEIVNSMTLKDAIEVFKSTNAYGTMDIAKSVILNALEQEPKVGQCKNCKWWKDSDGLYRRGGHAESQCPINRKEVFEGNGYCYMFEPQESEDKE